MINTNRFIALEILIENIAIAVLSPRNTQLSVPPTRQNVEKLLPLHRQQCEEVLVSHVAFKLVFFAEKGDRFFAEHRVVVLGLSHLVQIE